MKKAYLVILTALGFTTEALAASADESIAMSQEHLDAIQAAIDQKQSLAVELAAAVADRLAAQTALNTVIQEGATAANASAAAIETLTARVAELGGAAGAPPTRLPGSEEQPTAKSKLSGVPDYVDTTQGIYKLLASMP